MSACSSPLRSVAPRWLTDQRNMLIETILTCLITRQHSRLSFYRPSSSPRDILWHGFTILPVSKKIIMHTFLSIFFHSDRMIFNRNVLIGGSATVKVASRKQVETLTCCSKIVTSCLIAPKRKTVVQEFIPAGSDIWKASTVTSE